MRFFLIPPSVVVKKVVLYIPSCNYALFKGFRGVAESFWTASSSLSLLDKFCLLFWIFIVKESISILKSRDGDGLQVAAAVPRCIGWGLLGKFVSTTRFVVSSDLIYFAMFELLILICCSSEGCLRPFIWLLRFLLNVFMGWEMPLA